MPVKGSVVQAIASLIYGLWAGRDLYRAPPAVTQGGTGYSVSSEGPSCLITLYDKQCEDLYKPDSYRDITE